MAKRNKRGQSQSQQRKINRKISRHKAKGSSDSKPDHLMYRVSSGREPDPVQVRKIQKRKAKRWNAIMDRVPENRGTYGAEVGVWYGDTSERLLAGRPHLFLYLIDRWTPPQQDDSYFHSGAKIAGYSEAKHQDAYQATMKKIEPHKEHTTVLIGNTVEMANEIEDGFLDFVFIDADHSYDGVCNDIRAYLPKVKRTGWIGGHDWNSQWETEKAVLNFFPREIVERDVDHTWFIRLEDIDNLDDLLKEFQQ